MKKRTFLSALVGAVLAPLSVMAESYVDYTPGVIQSALDAGETVFVDYSATWCATCKRQERVINDIRASDAAYDAAMTFVKVDWDRYKNHETTAFHGVPRRSTLIVLRGSEELGRIIAGTSKSQIRSLMDAGL